MVVGGRSAFDLGGECSVILQPACTEDRGAGVEKVGTENPGLHQRDLDPELRHFLGQGFGKTFHSKFRRAVQRRTTHPDHATH
ncbi:hypothetical protein D3C86_1779120 [compost metagenome]